MGFDFSVPGSAGWIWKTWSFEWKKMNNSNKLYVWTGGEVLANGDALKFKDIRVTKLAGDFVKC